MICTLLRTKRSNLKTRDCFFVLSLFFALFIFSCGNNSLETGEKPLAKVGDSYLYPSDVKVSVFSSNGSKEDSTEMAKKYINNWVHETLLLQKAEKNLTDDKKSLTRW